MSASRARIVRRQAHSLGLRMIQRGQSFELRDASGIVLSGGLATIGSYVLDRYERRNPGPKPRVRPPSSWAPAIDDYLVTLAAAGRSPATIVLRRAQLTRMSRELGRHPAAITGEQLVDWLGRHTSWSLDSRRGHRAAARGFFLWAYKNKRIPEHIADDLPSVREGTALPRPTPDAAWNTALSNATPRVALMLRLAGEAGLRRAEIAQIHRSDLIEGLIGAQLLVHGKGGKKRVVPLNDSLADLIRRGGPGHTPGTPPDGWLFPDCFGGHLSADHVGGLTAKVLPGHWTLHSCRHRFASRAYRGTRNLRAVQTLLGHSSIATTQRYTAVDDDEMRAAMMAAQL